MKRMYTFLMTVALALLGVLSPNPAGVKAFSAPVLEATAASQLPATPCIQRVAVQFEALKHHGEATGFHLGAGTPDPQADKHYQGIQRAERVGTPFFFVSRNGNPGDQNVGGTKDPGNLLVVEMASRDGSGERLRSNQLAKGEETQDTVPPAEDQVVTNITFDGVMTDGSGGVWPDYMHAGGMQTVGDLLFVPLEKPRVEGASEGKLVIIDVSTPSQPKKLQEVELHHAAGTVAVVRQPSVAPQDPARFLIVIGGPNDNHDLKIYESSDPRATEQAFEFNLLDTWKDTELEGGGWPIGFMGTAAYQSLNLVRQCGGEQLFLLGTHHTSFNPEAGDDQATLYLVSFVDGEFKLLTLFTKHFYCNSASGRICNFAAAAAFYVSPAGEMILYGTEHENDGPNGTVRAGEFRHRHGFRPESSNYRPRVGLNEPYSVPEGETITLDPGAVLPPPAEAWAELYDDDHFLDRSVVFDWADRELEDLDDFSKLDDDRTDLLDDGFTDKASSVRWLAPTGCTIILHKDDGFNGDTLSLEGNGRVREIADLKRDTNPATGQPYNFGDETSSIEFSGATCDADGLDFAWDLDGQAGYETPGRQAPYSVTNIDGPATVERRFRMCSVFFMCTEGGRTLIVHNVEPSVDPILVGPPITEGGTVTLEGTFTDPGNADTHTLTVNWGDGTNESVPLEPGLREFSLTHQYLDDDPSGTTSDTYTVSVAVTDDDGGVGRASGEVSVSNIAPAIAGVTGPVDPVALAGNMVQVAASFTDAGSRDTHDCTFDWGDGSAVTKTTAPGSGNGTCVAQHTYLTPGVYGVAVNVADDDTESADGLHEYVVVYDPNGGYVTGGGWIDSPMGACRLTAVCEGLTGKAHFGFQSKYQRGATVPTGSTNFLFKTGALDFRSSAYEWLVVAGARAQYKGSGTINGTAGYKFILTARDGQLTSGGGADTFRIKIWEETSGKVVYDNQMGATDGADPTTVIGGGSIVVHK